MVTDRELLAAYNDGWHGLTPHPELTSQEQVAYETGRMHYRLGDDSPYWDSLSNEQILELIKQQL